MIEAVSKKTFLVRQESGENGRKDVIAHKGRKFKFTEEEAVRFWGNINLSETDKKKLLRVAKTERYFRQL